MKQNLKIIVVLIALIIIYLGVKYLYEPKLQSNQPFTKIIETKNIKKITIVDITTTTVIEKNENQWKITKPFNWYANTNEISDFLKAIESSIIYGPLTENEKMYSRFGIDENSKKISLTANNEVSFLLGKEGQMYNSVFIKFTDKKGIYELSGISPFEIKRNWDEFLIKNIIPFDEKEVEKISIKIKNKEFSFHKKDSSEWNDEKARNVFQKLKEIRFSSINPISQGNINPDITITITTKSGIHNYKIIKAKKEYKVYLDTLLFSIDEYNSKNIEEIRKLLNIE